MDSFFMWHHAAASATNGESMRTLSAAFMAGDGATAQERHGRFPSSDYGKGWW